MNNRHTIAYGTATKHIANSGGILCGSHRVVDIIIEPDESTFRSAIIFPGGQLTLYLTGRFFSIPQPGEYGDTSKIPGTGIIAGTSCIALQIYAINRTGPLAIGIVCNAG